MMDGTDGGAQWPTQPHRAGFRQKECNAESQRHANQHRNASTQHRAHDGNGCTKFFVDDVPLDIPKEFDPELGKRGPGIDEQRNNDAGQRQQHQKGERLRQAVKHHVLEMLATGNGHHACAGSLTGRLRVCCVHGGHVSRHVGSPSLRIHLQTSDKPPAT